jgi:hypothetical protein
MSSLDIISHRTTAELRSVAERYASVWPKRTDPMPGLDRFVRSYLEEPEASFLTRITPVVVSEIILERRVPDRLASLLIAVSDENQNWVLDTEVSLGEGEEPAVVVGPTVYGADFKHVRHANGPREMVGPLTEGEGFGLILDLDAAARHYAQPQGLLGRAIGVAKATLLR